MSHGADATKLTPQENGPPHGEHCQQLLDVDDSVGVQVRRAITARPPVGEHDEEIRAVGAEFIPIRVTPTAVASAYDFACLLLFQTRWEGESERIVCLQGPCASARARREDGVWRMGCVVQRRATSVIRTSFS
jgi:hypothetical protein